MINLVSHNSLTYLKPKKWWMKLLGFTAKCQRVTLEEQYNLGVRIFDLRLLPNVKNKTIEVRHGLSRYDCNLKEILNWMNKKKISCRILLEQNKENKKYQDKIDEEFFNICYLLETTYPDIKFFGGERKYDWKTIYKFTNDYPENAESKYSSVDSSSKLDDIYPYIYAKKHNKENIKNAIKDKKTYLWIDFIDMV